MAAVLLATICAVVYGMADFFGGLATRRSRVLAVVLFSQIAGLLFVLPLLPLLPGAPSLGGLVWGMAAGLCGGLALIFFYRALAGGVMSVVAPTTATMSVALPVLVGLTMGERPEPLALGGVALALGAVILVGRDSTTPGARMTFGPVVQALAAGAGFGAFFVLLKQVPEGTGMWPLFGARLASVTLVAALALFTGRTLRPGRGSLPTIVTAGVLDMAANVLYLLAAQRGLLVVVAVLVSLYPASTLVLARWVLKERLNAVQASGIGLALGAVALIAATAA
ncbi:multidrug transporter [Sphaerisporangium siamense]|uniref:Drug/metabolite transporter (DMT)-like permease n=1 Tax=Sphaerisporangium siamense TaxID=795645 RepID=A0A7W7D6X8_9ACTN|nr:DMT family transporter [Sphaerisporangium siamense]MBB4701337.1 drug/metabolite transporter (DMT)-like permease [Sphaerisporangium siamense]GII87294.1 multidrug transporter [Sphaerisporangium siamense]